MTPSEFAAKWHGVTTGERASALLTDHDAHDAAYVVVDRAASARPMKPAPRSPSESLLGSVALRAAPDTSLRLASLDPAADADLPPLARDPDLGSRLQRAGNEILLIAEKIGQMEQLQRPR